MDDFADLLPLFVSEVKERLERLVELVRRIDPRGQAEGLDPGVLPEVKRELHTVKGAARMMGIQPIADLAHAAEALVKTPRGDVAVLLVRAADRLVAMVEVAGTGVMPDPEPELVALLAGPRFGPEPVTASLEPLRAAPEPLGEVHTANPVDPTAGDPQSMGPAEIDVSAIPNDGVAADRDARPPQRTNTSAAATPQAAAGPASSARGDLRLDAVRVDQLSEQAARLRLLALAGAPQADRLYELASLAEQGVREPAPTQVLALLASSLRRAAVELEGRERRLRHVTDAQFETILDLQLQPLRPFLATLSRHARELARQLDREVEVELAGEETRLDRRITRELEAALVHLVRNAVDHGLEPPAERLAAGKPAGGRLTITAQSDGARVALRIADDGRGVDASAVRAAAVARGLLSAHEVARLPEGEALRLVFLPGLSTRVDESEISGRGVGLDAVWAAVTRLGGTVTVASTPGRGTSFELVVPATRRGEQVLVVRVGRLRLALVRSAVERVNAVVSDQLFERGGQLFARLPQAAAQLPERADPDADDPETALGERLVAYLPLARLFGESPAPRSVLLEGTISSQQLALLVDQVVGEEEVLVRPLGGVLASSPLLDGLALLASGEPVGVLAVSALLRQGSRVLPTAVSRAAPAARRLHLLLVDDSLVTREMERRLLVDAGFTVTAAADATEALRELAERAFDCVITDVEMPGMDGFELVRHLRSMSHLARLPVVVVSTRDRPEDRLRGLEAGADAYLTKQGLDAGELVGVVRRLAPL